jgi:long-chain acyl-CoA synthetase
MVNAPDIAKYDLTSINFVVSGSAPLPVEILRRFEELTDGVIIEGFGLTESSPVTHVNPVKGTRKPGSIGIAVPSTDARIVDLDQGTREQPTKEPGELVVKGPQVMKAYWNMPGETAEALRDGWLYTGDIAYMDDDGYAYIVDRKKDMIIAGGFNIYPRDVEEVIYQYPKVQEVVVAGLPDRYRGETVKAYIVLKAGETATPEEIMEFCKGKLAKFKVPTSVEFRDTLPKSMVGKILRRVLVEEEKKKMAAGS